MNIDIFTLCYNEIRIIPYVIDYWKRIARHVYVYDNGSTDGSIEYLRRYDFITVIPYYSDGELNDLRYLDIKNNVWKMSDADFVIVCDMDECVYHENLIDVLTYMKRHNQTISETCFINTISEIEQEHVDGKLYHEYDGTRLNINKIHDKCLIFDPHMITDIYYHPGCHVCQPQGHVSLYDRQERDPIKTIHIKDLSLSYKLDKIHTYQRRMSDVNKMNRFAYHYFNTDEQHTRDFMDALNSSKKYDELFEIS